MSIEEIASHLIVAREREKDAISALAPRHQGGEWEAFEAASGVVLRLERELAAAKGEQYAVPLDFPVKWDIGAPMPHLFCGDDKTFLTFFVADIDPGWDGSTVTVRDPKNNSADTMALVEFLGCASAKLGSPNDEVFEGHALHEKGMESYAAQRVVNSLWLAELEAINRVHRLYNPARWRDLNHYVFWFHDSSFECVAKSYRVELFRESTAELFARVCQRLLS